MAPMILKKKRVFNGMSIAAVVLLLVVVVVVAENGGIHCRSCRGTRYKKPAVGRELAVVIAASI